jgi:hypothetical protein
MVATIPQKFNIVRYHQNLICGYVKFYVSIIIHIEVININVRNFNFPIGFYSNLHPLWTPQNMILTAFTTKLLTNMINILYSFEIEVQGEYTDIFKSPKQSLGDLLFLLRFLLLLLFILILNFNFPIGFYSNLHPLWTPQNMILTAFTTKLKTLGPTRNIYLNGCQNMA